MIATKRHVVLWLLLIPLALATSSAAQSFLGTIRGTVARSAGRGRERRGGAHHRRGHRRRRAPSRPTIEGRYEAANLRPGTYNVEVMAPSFKKFEKTTVLVRAAGTALVDVALEVGGVNETITVSGEAANNITLDSQAISRGLDAQQLHDLPRNSPRHPVVPAPEPERRGRLRRHPVPRREDLRRVVHPGRPGLDERDLRHRRQLGARASTRSRRCRCSRTPTAPSTAASPAWSSRPSAAASSIAAPASSTTTATA